MGSPKALIDWHGMPLVTRVAGIVARIAAPVVVVRAAGQELPTLTAGVETAEDASPGRGPLEGIAAGMRALRGRADAAYVTAADVPLLHPEFIERVAAELDGHDVVLPVAGGQEHFLAAVYRLSLLPLVEGLLATNERRAGLVAERAAVRRLEVRDRMGRDSLRNVNTPEELAAARALPLPRIAVTCSGAVAEHLGVARTDVEAASLGQLLAALPGVGDLLPHVAIGLNGRPAAAQADAPLVAGDRVALS
jgi:molybdopterin-guanine dinucleotide biosynthesis protein A